MANSVFTNALNKMKATLVPVKDDKVRITMNGDLACPSNGEYHAFINGELTSVPEELLLDVPMFRISKPIDKVQPGDVIKTSAPKTLKDGSVCDEGKFTYRLVRKIKDGKIYTTSYSGAESTITPIKDFFLGQKTASVVVNCFGSMFNSQGAATGAAGIQGMNPMMMFMLMDRKGGDGDLKSILPFMMMQGGQANVMNNPMMAMMLLGDGKTDMSDMLMFSMMQNGGFNNLFGMTPVQPTPTVTAVTPTAPTEE